MRHLHVTPDPFPHFVVDGLFDLPFLQQVQDEIPLPEEPGWRRFENGQERKLEGPSGLWGSFTLEYLARLRDMAPLLGDLFNIPDLTMETVGGGYHLIPPGGYLAVHTDFSRSPKTRLYRRLNLLTYLNHEWNDEGGHLELWGDEALAVDVAPEFGRTVCFATSSRSWHGHPKPAQRWRASVAGYFFSPEPPPGFTEQSTVWRDAS